MWIVIIIVVIILISIIAKIFEWLRENIGKILLVIGIIIALSVLIYLIGAYPDVMKTVGIVTLWIIGAVIAIIILVNIIRWIIKCFKENYGKILPVIGIIAAVSTLIYLIWAFPDVMKTIGIVILWIIGSVVAIIIIALVISGIASAVKKAAQRRRERLEAERIERERERQRQIKNAFESTQTEVENFIIANKTNDAETIYNSLSKTLARELGILMHEDCVDNANNDITIIAFFCKGSITYYFLKKLLRENRGFTRDEAVECCRSNQLPLEKIDDDISRMTAENIIKKLPMGKEVLFSSNLPGNKMISDEINCD